MELCHFLFTYSFEIMKKGFFKRYFLTGLVVLIPFGASALIVTWLFRLLDSWAHPISQRLLGHYIPGVGLLVTVVVIFAVGVLASNVLGKWVIGWIDHLSMEVPVFRSIYSTLKQIFQLFSPTNTETFQSVVLATHPETGTECLGFATHELKVDGKIRIAVYFPTNHVYLGTTYFFSPEHVRRTDISVQDAIQSAISAGATLPKDLTTKPWN